jgi:hypothetical protein
MRQILETEEYVQIPPQMYSDPFYRITYLIKEEIRKYKWIEGERGHELSWEQARQEWADVYREKYEKFLMDTLYFPERTPPGAEDLEEQRVPATAGNREIQTSDTTEKMEPPLPRDRSKENMENPAQAQREKGDKEKTALGTKEAIHRVSSGQV